MIQAILENINREDLDNLIINSVPEGKTIDYKASFPGNSDSDKKEFLADISSFANTSGGDLIFGVDEENGMPTKIVGIKVMDVDAEIRKYENIVREGLDPRINLTVKAVLINDDNYVFVFRSSKSWIGPHRVVFKSHDKFYGRNSAGKYPLDTNELRSAFTLSSTLIDKIHEFKVSRIISITNNETPVPFFGDAKIILHLIPIQSFDYNFKITTSEIDQTKLRPMYSMGWNNRINLEGLVTYTGGRSNDSHSYVQIYRNGIIEAVEGGILNPDKPDKKIIPSITFEEKLLEILPQYLSVLNDSGISTPIFVYLTLSGIKDYEMGVNPRLALFNDHFKIDRDILEMPEVVIENFGTNIISILRPIFDLIWNACGYEESLNFNVNGEWVPNR